ncbi:MAG TPA: sigma factor-like helix-turn-helix DNA-binding protein [Terriglobales bacterium]|nr:sigma factor-like helix-turn-helix DNA-binding protein [Terriglobales bacterium]
MAEDSTPPVANRIALEVEIGPETRLLPEVLGEELWRVAGASRVEVSKAEFAEALEAIAARDNFGLDPGKQANERQQEIFWRALHLEELAIARGCALGRESAWRRFLAEYREQLTRTAVEMTGSAALGEELASALYSELFGLTEREGRRWSPLLRYSGRGSLMGWLRAILAQRRVNQYRKIGRETGLGEIEPAARVSEHLELKQLEDMRGAIKMTLSAASAEERFLLSAYYLDQHTLHEISRVLRVHEATVSRKLKRATEHLRKELLRTLRTRGLSRRAAEEALGTDPRDVDINLRNLLQKSEDDPNSNKERQE